MASVTKTINMAYIMPNAAMPNGEDQLQSKSTQMNQI